MTSDANLDFEPAAAHLDATLAGRRGGPVARSARTAASLALAILTGDTVSGPSQTDLVVSRRQTGNEVLRVSAGTLEEADRLLATVREDLRTKSVAEFIAEWRA
jgi:hypothetical protein